MVGAFHLETDAALNPARTKPEPKGPPLLFAGGGVVVRTEAVRPVATYSVELGYVGGSNEAEAICLLRGMELARERHGATALRVRSDCLPLVRSLKGEEIAHAPRFVAALDLLRVELGRFERFDLRWTPGTHGADRADGLPTADALARKAAGLGPRSVRRRPRRLGSV